MNFTIEFEQEDDGRWLAEIPALPGVMVYGATRSEAESRVEALALRVIADGIERDNSTMTHVHFAAAWASGPKVRRVYKALLRLGWVDHHIIKGSSHRQLVRDGYADFTWAFHDSDEIGPKMLARIARRQA